MTFSQADVDSAIAKLSTLEFSQAETEAVASVLLSASDDEVSGFQKGEKGHDFLQEVSGFLPFQAGPMMMKKMGPPPVEPFTATDDLAK